MADPWSGREPATSPTAQWSGAPAPVDPWAASAPPVTLAPTGLLPEPTPRRSRRWLVPVVAATAVLAVIIFIAVVVWPASDGPDAPLAFHPVAEAGQVAFGADARPALAHLTGDRLYAGATVGDHLELVATDLAADTEAWRTIVRGGSDQSWDWLIASPTAVVLSAGPRLSAHPRLLVSLDPVTGQERWRREVPNRVAVFVREGVLAFTAEADHVLTGLDPVTGRATWEVDYSSEDSGRSPALTTVLTAADYAGAGSFDGAPVHRSGGGVIVVSADRSARLIDLATGEPTWQHSNVADPTDVLFAYDGWLYVTEQTEGYRVLAYDLTTPGGQPRTLYPVEDTTRHPITPPQPCGRDRICLLDQSGYDQESIEVVAIDTADGQGQAWRRPAPGADQLTTVGELVVASGGTPAVVAFDRDGAVAFEQPAGLAVRLNEGNLLVFGEDAWSSYADVSLLGYALAERRLVALHTVREVNATACAWGTVAGEGFLACPTRQNVTIWRFASD